MQETFLEKLERKHQENPLVIPGMVTTVATMIFMSSTLFKRDKIKFQFAQRLRVGSQLLVIGAVAISFLKMRT